MKTADKVLVTIVLLSVLACSKDDGNNTNLNDPTDPMSEAENKAPGAFTLLEVVDGATDVELFPTLTWNTATDPDGDQVVYDVYMDTDTNPETKVASDLSNTTFTLSEKLDLALDHYWKVIAKDGKGGEAQSETFRFTTRPIRATRITQEADLPPRGYHAAVVYNNALYVMNGTNDNGELSDLWVAYDLNNGFESIAVNDSDFPGLRIGQTLTVFGENGSQDSRITSIGGRQSVTFYADVSSTVDTNSWSAELNDQDAPYRARAFHTAVVFKDLLWIIGGYRFDETLNTSFYFDDVWVSSDSRNWIKERTSGNFKSITYHTSVVFDGKIWIIGGLYDGNISNLVLCSGNGKDWQAKEGVNLPPVLAHTSVVFDNKIWVIGGAFENGAISNEIWYSKDGQNWIDATPTENFTRRLGHVTTVFNDQIVLIGGQSLNGYENDVWVLE